MDKATKKRRLRYQRLIRESFKVSDKYTKALYLSESIDNPGPRGGKRYTCNKCKKAFKKCEIEVNHTTPVTEYSKRSYEYEDLDFYTRVFTLPIEVLCKQDHLIVTKEQNKNRIFKRKRDKK